MIGRPGPVWWLLLALLASAPAPAGQPADGPGEPVAADDPFAAFDDFDDAFADDDGGLKWTGFVEAAYGRKLDRDIRFDSRQSLGDLRARVETEWVRSGLVVGLKLDGLYDDVESDIEFKARELSLQFSPASDVDLKIGRQVLTWGTGDLLFLNDLFPKSWVSFFSGRDDEYLKAPSDAVRVTWYAEAVNLDVVWSPEFEPDDYLTGERFAFFSPLAGSVVAPRPPLSARTPDGGIGDGELALRLFRTVGSTEYAAYAYRGYFKRPLGVDQSLLPEFPRLSVIGASLRRPLGAGIVSAEFAWHDSRSDGGGDDPSIPNSQLRLLAGFEFEARARLNVAFQAYVERTRDYASLIASSLTPSVEPDRTRALITNRLTWRNPRDTLTFSLFTFYSPTDRDYHVRPAVSLRRSDRLTVAAGLNLFGGNRVHTFFGQLEDNSNGYFRIRFNY